MNAIDRAHVHTGGILRADTRFRDDLQGLVWAAAINFSNNRPDTARMIQDARAAVLESNGGPMLLASLDIEDRSSEAASLCQFCVLTARMYS